MSYFISTNLLSSSNINSTATVNASALHPLSITNANDSNLTFDQLTKGYADGYSLNRAECFVDIKDVKYNNDSLVWLTSAQTYNDMFIEKDTLTNVEDYLSTFGFVYTYIRTQPIGTDVLYYLGITSGLLNVVTTSADATIAKISKLDNGNFHVTFDGAYLTVDTSDYSVSVQDTLSIASGIVQEFGISLQNTALTIYIADGDTKRYVGINALLEIKAFGIFTDSTTTRYDTTTLLNPSTTTKNRRYFFELYFESLNEYNFGADLAASTAWVQYYNELNDKANLKNVNINTDKSVKSVPVNHLLVSPHHASINSTAQTIDIQHLPLKNMMTPEQNYTLTPFSADTGEVLDTLSPELKPKRREYQKIFSGDKDVNGYDKLLLTFTSNTKMQSIESEGEEYFHYPFEASQLPLSASGLIEAGAIPGSTPFNSDRIYKKNAKYQDFIYWGESQQLFGCDDGAWLCAWLSGSEGSSLSGMENSVWVDRWYDPTKITVGDALTLGYLDIQAQINSPAVFDVPSELTLDPGVYYRYDRVSNTRLDYITDTFNLSNTALRLHYKDEWDGVADDQSQYGNDGNIRGYSSSDLQLTGPAYGALDQTSLKINDGGYIDIPYSTSMELTGSFTMAGWVQSDNWTDNPGSSILATNFRGGISLDYNKHFFNPIVSVIENTYGHAIQYSLCSPLADTKVPVSVSFKTLAEATDILECETPPAPPPPPPPDPTYYSVAGAVYTDVDGNSALDVGDTGIESVQVQLASGTDVKLTTTDGDGEFTFSSVVSGNWTITETDPATYYSTTPNTSSITVTSNVTGIQFLDTQYATISGTVYETP